MITLLGQVFFVSSSKEFPAPISTERLKKLSAKTAVNPTLPSAYCRSAGNQMRSELEFTSSF